MGLAKSLQALLDIAEKGEWEKADEQLQDLLLSMETVRTQNARDLAKAASPEQVAGILQLLNSAIVLCSARKDQIAPLINAFAATLGDSAKP